MTDNQTQENKEREDYARKTLEDSLHQHFVGSNYILANPYAFGEIGQASGKPAYASVMTSDEAKKIRDSLYKQNMAEWQNSGLYEKPSYPTDWDLARKLDQGVKESSMVLKLKDLEAIVSKIAGEGVLTDKVPKELSDYTREGIIKKAVESKLIDPKTGSLDLSKLPKEEQEALQLYNALMESYTLAVAKKLTDNSYLARPNAVIKQIADRYKPKEAETKEATN